MTVPGATVADWADQAGLVGVRPHVSTAADEVELDPTEVADAAGGEMLGRATLPFARAVDKPTKHPATFKQVTPVAATRYCPKCYLALAMAAREKCNNCGAPLKRN